MLGVYFSGTGNSKFCVEYFVKNLQPESKVLSIEDNDILKYIEEEDELILGYPIYFSNIPFIVRDFIETNGQFFQGKQVFIIATMGLFSGDGSGCAARLLKRKGATIIGGLHLKMPDCIADGKLLKKSYEKNQFLIEKATEKMQCSLFNYIENSPTQEGLGFFYYLAGLFGQRLWFYTKTSSYKDEPKINNSSCIKCKVCIESCPTGNLTIRQNKVIQKKKCTLCYRCVNQCPTQSITILGKEVIEQVYLDKFINGKYH